MASGASSSTPKTEREQKKLEHDVSVLLSTFAVASNHSSMLLELCRDEHVRYLRKGYHGLGESFVSLDSSRPWLCYWILHSLAMLNQPFGPAMNKRTVEFLSRCQDPHGGYGGGPGQMAHLATTYAAVNALVTVGGEKALGSINRVKLLGFLLRMKQPSGGFTMHEGGEIDVRGCYTAISVAHIVNIMTPELVENVPEYISSCQTYEGGIGCEPGVEAHGGYTFCGLAALALIDKVHALDLPALLNWVVFRQGRVEGGFQGRTNKLVDGCYSLWQGGIFSIIQQIMPELNRQQLSSDGPLWAFHEQFISYSISKTEEPPGEDATPSSSSKDIESEIQTTEECCVREVGTAQDDSELKESTSTRRVAEASKKSTTAGVQHQPSSSVNTWWDKTEATSAGFSSRQAMTAEYLFPVVDGQVKRAPISVTFEEVSDEVLDTSCNSDKPNLKKRLSIVDQLLNEDKQVLYGPLDNPQALQAYILLCCQVLDGGLRDKPGKSPDYYHTCYCLSGLTLAQNSAAHRINAPPPPKAVLGPYSNVLEPVHPLCNVDLNKYNDAVRYFKHHPC